MDKTVKTSWEKNAQEWIKIVKNDEIPSRKYTNPAILKAIYRIGATKIADMGCGEGWLVRKIHHVNAHITGIDATAKLIDYAKNQGKGSFHQLSFEEIIAGKPIPGGPFDLMVFNFSLYLKDDLLDLLRKSVDFLQSSGTILIQTLHPYFLVTNGNTYENQWVQDSWKGLPGDFTDGHQWYARNFEGWSLVLNQLNNASFGFQEVLNEKGQPISLIIEIKKSE
ncbi:Methyltransferase type 11 [Croceitalea dokdonensis DOKDO 023]|uniref:Methyltransferase type 11 n=1 Tax=Croceitalea dokdonensis DOKDO 023 TaxID=1300341 RepID=A0A0P7AUW1_9FLAO|nr:class I SAM-dependent methyltransferase [Croceitalea dokdonensis]KPM31663.1 Methyltransferase type 11 [Croceitalea dokdonensis DOKDO 023]